MKLESFLRSEKQLFKGLWAEHSQGYFEQIFHPFEWSFLPIVHCLDPGPGPTWHPRYIKPENLASVPGQVGGHVV